VEVRPLWHEEATVVMVKEAHLIWDFTAYMLHWTVLFAFFMASRLLPGQ
jgi:hypothetical protein